MYKMPSEQLSYSDEIHFVKCVKCKEKKSDQNVWARLQQFRYNSIEGKSNQISQWIWKRMPLWIEIRNRIYQENCITQQKPTSHLACYKKNRMQINHFWNCFCAAVEKHKPNIQVEYQWKQLNQKQVESWQLNFETDKIQNQTNQTL